MDILNPTMGNIKVDWHLGYFDIERWGQLLYSGSQYAVSIRKGQTRSHVDLLAICEEMTCQWEALLNNYKESKNRIDELKKQLDTIKNKSLSKEMSNNKEYINILLKWWAALLRFELIAKLGVPFRREMSEEDRLSNAMK